MTASVRVDGVSHWFGAFQALRTVTLDIEAGEYIALLGPSGCGKTTLLSVLGGFEYPSAGRILVGGADVTALPPAKRPTTTMFQDYALFPHMTLRDNVAFGLRMAGQGKRVRAARAIAHLDSVGMAAEASKRPHQISGGQRQRVALARALAVSPDVLLLDEPLGALDLKLRRAMQEELKAIQRRVGTTFIHVTHDQEEAMAIADRIVVMQSGRIEDAGPPARVYQTPATLFAADFMGEMNHIPGQVTAPGCVDTPMGVLPAPASLPVGRAVACIRPEALRHDGVGLALGHAHVQDATFFGTHFRTYLSLDAAPDLRLIAHLPPDRAPSSGERLALSVRAEDYCVFAEETS